MIETKQQHSQHYNHTPRYRRFLLDGETRAIDSERDCFRPGVNVIRIGALALRWVRNVADAIPIAIDVVLQHEGLVLHVEVAVNCSLARFCSEK